MKWNRTRFNYLSSVAIVYTLKTLIWETNQNKKEKKSNEKKFWKQNYGSIRRS